MQYCAYCGNAVEAVSHVPCPQCGNPSNGAPRPKASSGMSPAVIVIIAIVGVMVILAILGVVAAIAIPNYIMAMQRAKQKRTMADIRSLGVAIESYAADNNEYPKGAAPADLSQALVPKYIKVVPVGDGWQHSLQYVCLKDATSPESEKCTGYVIASPGKDGRYERDSPAETAALPERTSSNFDCDIVYSNGTFKEYPEGAQQ